MTTLIVIDGQASGETRTKAVARRLRSEIAGRGINKSAAARICGVTQPWMSRRINGLQPFGIEELDMVCSKLGVSFAYVATGIRELPDPGDGGSRLGESNPRPIHYAASATSPFAPLSDRRRTA